MNQNVNKYSQVEKCIFSTHYPTTHYPIFQLNLAIKDQNSYLLLKPECNKIKKNSLASI
jgi:hypothetical protein